MSEKEEALIELLGMLVDGISAETDSDGYVHRNWRKEQAEKLLKKYANETQVEE